MKKFICSVVVLFLGQSAFGLSLLQETRDILCKNGKKTVFVDKRDRFFEAMSQRADRADFLERRYKATEFLDRGILGKASGGKSALFQVTPKERSSLIEGKSIEFKEKNCEQVKAHKVCKKDGVTLEWAPTYLMVDGQKLDVKHYGVYPNDGTFFIAYDSNSNGVALVDYGSKFVVIQGKHTSYSCSYVQN